jgi:hypothetical protein
MVQVPDIIPVPAQRPDRQPLMHRVPHENFQVTEDSPECHRQFYVLLVQLERSSSVVPRGRTVGGESLGGDAARQRLQIMLRHEWISGKLNMKAPVAPARSRVRRRGYCFLAISCNDVIRLH